MAKIDLQRKNSISVEDTYAAESDSRTFLGYAGLILLLVGALLFFVTFVADAGGPHLAPSARSAGSSANSDEGPPQAVTAAAEPINEW